MEKSDAGKLQAEYQRLVTGLANVSICPCREHIRADARVPGPFPYVRCCAVECSHMYLCTTHAQSGIASIADQISGPAVLPDDVVNEVVPGNVRR